MKKILFTIIAATIYGFAMGQDTIKHNDLKWILGSWEMNTGEVMIYESWEKGKGDSYTGKGYVIKGADTLFTETMKIEMVGGFWVFIAQINDYNPVLFTLKTGSTEKQLTFENMEHDNPQRVVYKYVSEKEMHAQTEAMVEGKEVIEEYNYTRR